MILASSASTTDDPVKALGVGGGGTEIHSSSVYALVGTERTVFFCLFVLNGVYRMCLSTSGVLGSRVHESYYTCLPCITSFWMENNL